MREARAGRRGHNDRVFLTLTSTAEPATDLGYLLHKHPDRVQVFELPVGRAHVYYPEATADRCTVALHVEVDPIALVRGKRSGAEGFALAQYVNDRAYAASSMLAVALGRVFGTAMKGRCAARPDLEGVAIPLTIHVPATPTSEGPEHALRLFAPLGWAVETLVVPLDPDVPRWGDAPYVDLTLTGTLTVAEALNHLYVLLPVLDGSKHYWVGTDEVDKLVRTGGGWLRDHPEQALITSRYLERRRGYVIDALARLAELDDDIPAGEAVPTDESTPRDDPSAPTVAPTAIPLVRLRIEAVLQALADVGAHRVVDLGCGEGALLRELLATPTFSEVVGVDVSARALERAEKQLHLERLSDTQRRRIRLRQSSATYRDTELVGYDAVVLMEVVEHLDPDRLPDLERSVFGHAHPGSVVVTTPNADHNVLYPHLAAGTMRHRDHRFEWSRSQFADWAEGVAATHGYAVELRPVGAQDPAHGSPTQLALFTQASGHGGAA